MVQSTPCCRVKHAHASYNQASWHLKQSAWWLGQDGVLHMPQLSITHALLLCHKPTSCSSVQATKRPAARLTDALHRLCSPVAAEWHAEASRDQAALGPAVWHRGTQAAASGLHRTSCSGLI